jgi:hypothetical protein
MVEVAKQRPMNAISQKCQRFSAGFSSNVLNVPLSCVISTRRTFRPYGNRIGRREVFLDINDLGVF